MKKILLVAGIVLLSLTANAQEKSKGLQGVWWAAGNVSVGDSKPAENDVLVLAGTFITPDVTLALGIGNTNSITEGIKSNTLTIMPLVRKYWNVKGGLFFFGQAALPIASSKESISGAKSSSVTLAIAPGFDYIINKWLTIETSVTVLSAGTNTSNSTTNFDFKANPFSAGSIGNLRVGFKFLF